MRVSAETAEWSGHRSTIPAASVPPGCGSHRGGSCGPAAPRCARSGVWRLLDTGRQVPLVTTDMRASMERVGCGRALFSRRFQENFFKCMREEFACARSSA